MEMVCVIALSALNLIFDSYQNRESSVTLRIQNNSSNTIMDREISIGPNSGSKKYKNEHALVSYFELILFAFYT